MTLGVVLRGKPSEELLDAFGVGDENADLNRGRGKACAIPQGRGVGKKK